MNFLLEDIKLQQVQTLGELIYGVSSVYSSYYANLGVPLITGALPLFTGLPIADAWNDFCRATVGDLHALYTQVYDLSPAISHELGFCQFESQLGESAIEYVKTQLPTPTRYQFQGLETWTVTNSFRNLSDVDHTATSGVEILLGCVELERTSVVDLNGYANISLEDGYVSPQSAAAGSSNGFVGNTHEVTVATVNTGALSGLTQLIKFNGDGNLRAKLNVVLKRDSDWFEYEVCNIPDATKISPCNSLGFTYGVQLPGQSSVRQLPWYTFHSGAGTPVGIFPPLPTTTKMLPTATGVDRQGNYVGGVNPVLGSAVLTASGTPQPNIRTTQNAVEYGGQLILGLSISFPEGPQTITHITVTPHAIEGLNPFVEQVTAVQSIDGSTIYGQQVPGTMTFVFTPTIVDSIRIILIQGESYETKIGHLVWLGQSPNTNLTELPGSGYLPVVPGGQVSRVPGPTPLYSRILAGAKTVESTLDTTTVPNGAVGPYIEAFDGWRYAIGLRAITVERMEYLSVGTFTSLDSTVPISIARVRLEVDESVPVGGTPITYELSFDRGNSWYPIAPISRPVVGTPSSYVLGNGVGLVGTPLAIASRTVRLRATLTATDSTLPSVNANDTPRLFYYTLHLEGTA
jgi:hypothetical protein